MRGRFCIVGVDDVENVGYRGMMMPGLKLVLVARWWGVTTRTAFREWASFDLAYASSGY